MDSLKYFRSIKPGEIVYNSSMNYILENSNKMHPSLHQFIMLQIN